MTGTPDANIEREAEAAGLSHALREHRDDVQTAARAAAGYQRRRVPVDDMFLEPAHVFRVAKPGNGR